MACTACGTENRPGSRFCDSCGTPLESSCPSCGDTNRADARFCASCGTPLGGADASAAASTDPANRFASTHGITSGGTGAERRLVTVLFTDLVGFTTLAEDRDPEAVRELLSRYFDTATEIVQLHGGTVEKFIGDAVMAVWGTPIAHEDDAERAVRAALELVSRVPQLHPGLQARGGVLTGEAAVTVGATNQGMVAGDLVNTAARLQGVAEAGVVLVGEATRHGAEQAIIFEPLGEHTLKGKAAPVPAWCAVRVVAQRGGQGRADALEPPFVGRDEELRQLKDVLHAVGREARPRLVSITGPGGIGKSRLVWELEKYVDGVSERIYWHRGRSPSYGEGITFWALGEMVRRRAQLTEEDDEPTTRQRITAMLEEYVDDPADRERIGPAVLSLLGVAEAPAGGRDALFPAWRLLFERIADRGTTVLVFEDLQWADTGLLDFIDHLLDWTRGLPIIVVTLARPELFGRRPEWGAGRRQLTALALEPLSDDAVRQLLEGLVPGLPADAVAAIVGRAEGIPLYAVETVRGLLADGHIERRGEAYAVVGDLSQLRVPDSLRSLIASRLDALEPDDRVLLQDAAVLGQVFSADAVAAITGTEAASLKPRLMGLVRRELLDFESDPRSPERGQYRFVQSLIREVAYGTLSRRDRRARHLAVARHYEALGEEELAGALASHYVAAHEASEEGAEAEAVATQARLALVAAAERAAALGAHQQAISHLEQALAIAGGPEQRAPLLDRAAISATAAALPDAQAYASAAVDAYRAIGDAPAAVAAEVRLGRVLLDASEIDRAVELLEGIVAEAEALDRPDILATVYANLSRGFMRRAEARRAIEVADRALDLSEIRNLDGVTAEALLNKGAALSQLGRAHEAIALESAALDLSHGMADIGFQFRVRNNLASTMADHDPEGSARILDDAAELARDVGDRAMYAWLLGNVAAARLAEGRGWREVLDELSEALEALTLPSDRLRTLTFMTLISQNMGREGHIDEMRKLAGEGSGFETRFAILMVECQQRLLRGDPAGSFELARQAAELHAQNPEAPARAMLLAGIFARDPALIRAAAAAVDALPLAGPWAQNGRRFAAAAVAAAEGRTPEAASDFRVAYEGYVKLGVHFDAAQSLVTALTLLPGHPELVPFVPEARSLLESSDAQPWLDWLADVTAPPTGAGATPAAVTTDERVPG